MTQGLAALRLLVVDDNPHMRAIVLSLVQGLGVREVRQAADGGEGLRLLREAPADVALVDLNMAPLDGVRIRWTWFGIRHQAHTSTSAARQFSASRSRYNA